MTILTNAPRLPGAQPFAALVEIELVGEDGAAVAGYITGTGQVVQSQLQFHADGSHALSSAVGEWSVNLTPNASIEPAGTAYRIVEHRGRSGHTTHIVSVPASGGPYTVLECLSDLPGALPAPPLAAHIADALDAHDASAVSVAAGLSLVGSNVQAVLGAPLGTAIGTVSVAGPNPVVTFTSVWGLTAGGVPYFDPDGAASGEDAVLIATTEGHFALVRPE